MQTDKRSIVIVLLLVIVVLLVMNLLAWRFDASIAMAGGGGGHQGSEGWIGWSGQKPDGTETVFVLNTKRGQPRKVGNFTFNDNGPRLAVYHISNEGKIKFTSMRNIGADVDEYLNAIAGDPGGPTVKDIRDQQLKGRQAGDTDKEELPDDNTAK